MAISTSEQLIDAIRESGLLTDEQLDEAAAATEGLPDIKRTAVRLIKQGYLSRWQANRIIAGSYPGYLSKYKLIDRLTESDAGCVYLAEHERMERRVILKTLSRQEEEDSEPVQRFLADARKLAMLDHRNIIHIYDVDKEGDVFCLVMEYVQGEDLQKIVERDGPLPLHAAAGYIALAADALGHAHAQGIEHHSIKPDRLLLNTKGELKVLDIGIAGLVDPDQESRDMAYDGGPAVVDYLAPEQATGRNKVDHRADIYSLGGTFFFLLTGRVPFDGETSDDRLKARLRKAPPNVLEYRPDTPPELAEICSRAMATQPRERFASAAEVAQALDKWLKENGPPAAAVPPRPAARRDGSTDGNGQTNADDSAAFDFAAEDPVQKQVSKRASGRRTRKQKKAATDSGDVPADVAAPLDPELDPDLDAAPTVANKLLSPVVLISIGGAVVSLLLVIILAIVYWPDGSGDGERSGTDGDVVNNGDGRSPSDGGGGGASGGLSNVVVTGANGRPSTAREDGWYPLAAGVPGRFTYSFVAQTSSPQVTGFRIDWLGDETRGQVGFAINEIEAFAGAKQSLDATNRLAVAGAKSDPPLPSAPAALAIDGNLSTACNIPLDAETPQSLFCSLASPVTAKSAGGGKAPYFVRLVFHTASEVRRPAGRFRVVAQTEPMAAAAAPTTVAPADARTLAYWRFEQASTNVFVKNLTQFGTPAAAQDVSQNGNSLYCLEPAVAPKIGDDVAAAEVRRGESVEKNTRSLNDTVSPPAEKPARYLITDSVRAKPTVDLAGYPLAAWTVEASFKLPKLDGVQTILGKNGRPTALPDAPLQLRVDGAKGQIEIAVIDRSGELCTATSGEGFSLGANQWVHVAAVCDGKQLKLYTGASDGKSFQQQSSVEVSGGLIGSLGDWTLGAGSRDSAIANDAMAVIDEVRISTVALDPKDFLIAAADTEVVVVDPKDPEPPTDPGPKDPGPKDPGPVTPPEFHVLQLEKADDKPAGLTFERQPDGFYVAGGTNHEQATYRLKANVKDLKDVTGIRLEVAPHETSGGKVGRSADGSFVITNVALQVSDAAGKKKTAVKLKAATADHSQAKLAVGAAIDGDAKTGWAVGPKLAESHWAVFDAEKPFGDGSPQVLWIDVHHAAGKKMTTAHFQIAAVTGTGRGEQLAAAMRAQQQFAKPFAEFAEDTLPTLPTKDFPAPDFADVRPLGTVQIGTVDDLQANLVGGDVGHGADGSFDLQAGDAADGEKMWDFRFASTEAGSTETIARLRLAGQELSMYWLPAAKDLDGAGNLRNCSLQLQIKDVTRQIPLRATADVQPIEFKLGKVKRGGNLIYVPGAPDPAEMRLELQVAPVLFDAITFEPEGPLAVDQGAAEAMVGESKSLKLKVSTLWESPSILLRTAASFKPPGVDKDTPLTLKAAQSALARVTRTLEPARKQLAGLEKKKVYDGRKKFKDPEKREYALLKRQFGDLKGAELDAAIERGKTFIAKVAEASDKADELVRLADKLQSPAEETGAYIQVRVFRVVDGKEIDLVRSTGWESP